MKRKRPRKLELLLARGATVQAPAPSRVQRRGARRDSRFTETIGPTLAWACSRFHFGVQRSAAAG